MGEKLTHGNHAMYNKDFDDAADKMKTVVNAKTYIYCYSTQQRYLRSFIPFKQQAKFLSRILLSDVRTEVIQRINEVPCNYDKARVCVSISYVNSNHLEPVIKQTTSYVGSRIGLHKNDMQSHAQTDKNWYVRESLQRTLCGIDFSKFVSRVSRLRQNWLFL